MPSLRFNIDADSITVYNNELGFEEPNMRAVCDVGKTTKGKHKFGYIGLSHVFICSFTAFSMPIHSQQPCDCGIIDHK